MLCTHCCQQTQQSLGTSVTHPHFTDKDTEAQSGSTGIGGDGAQMCPGVAALSTGSWLLLSPFPAREGLRLSVFWVLKRQESFSGDEERGE